MASSLPAKKILVVDDNQIILNVLSSALKSGGYEVFAAVDGPAAFTVVLQEQPDLILLDIFFPPDIFQSGNTWDGFLIMRWLQCMGGPRANRTPVFVISGLNRGNSGSLSGRRRSELLPKTGQDTELLDAIQQILARV